VFVDVGANVGTYSMLAGKVCGARVIAIEPSSDALPFLHRNIRANGIEPLVTVRNLALSRAPGKVAFSHGQGTMNRIVLDPATDCETVEADTMDNVLAGTSPTMLKIDVEGFQLDVLAGAAATLRSETLQVVICEDGDMKEIAELLTECGFSTAIYDPFKRRLEYCSPDHIQNVVWVRTPAFIQQRCAEADSFRVAGFTI
jgi:FkbM family methyltransferase